MENNDTVLTINNGHRKISMYFKELENGELEMQMAVNPEIKEDEEPDLPILLANVIISAIQEDDKPKIYDGEN